LHPEKHPKYFQKNKQKSLIAMDVEEQVDNTSELEGKINYTSLQKEVALVGFNHN
jgi:hypothetical protein